jgi:hypothetical protein
VDAGLKVRTGVASEVRVKRLDGARRIDPWTVEAGARSNELEKLARVSGLGLANGDASLDREDGHQPRAAQSREPGAGAM